MFFGYGGWVITIMIIIMIIITMIVCMIIIIIIIIITMVITSCGATSTRHWWTEVSPRALP